MLLLYTVLSVVHLFGGWPGLQSHVIGERLDGPVYLWFNWWGREALFHLHTNPFETQHIYYPLGTSLIITPFSIIQSLLGAPIDVFFGPVATAGTHYVQSLQWSDTALVAGLAPGLLAVALLTVNNLRDVVGDE